MKKPRIRIKAKPLTDIERAIYSAGAHPATKEAIDKMHQCDEFELDPSVIDFLKSINMTPEDFVERMRTGDIDRIIDTSKEVKDASE
jgi:hypothetical protein